MYFNAFVFQLASAMFGYSVGLTVVLPRLVQLLLFVVFNSVLCSNVVVSDSTETKINGTYTRNSTLTLESSPYVVTSDITVNNGTTLTIEAGVHINFQARVRFHVRGTLIAQGSPDNEIVMFHNVTAGVDSTSIRLVGGDSPREGRVEVFNGQSWGTVCDDNWNSSSNARVVCRHLGFGRPLESSTNRFGQGSGIVGMSNVQCEGTENSLFDCWIPTTWNNGTCGHSEDVGVVCGTVGGVGHWGGVVFYGDSAIESISYNAYKYRSNSVLKNVKIINAGMAANHLHFSHSYRYHYYNPDRRVPAVTMTRASPTITNVSIIDSRSFGIQMNDLHGDAHFSGLSVQNSTNSGITGSCSWQFQCYGCHLYGNGYHGIDVKAIDLLQKQPPVSSTQTYEATFSSLTSHSIDDRGAYINFSVPNGYRYSAYSFQSSIETTPGYGLAIALQGYSYHLRYARIIDGMTGQSVYTTYSPYYSNSRTVTISSHKMIIMIDLRYYWRPFGATDSYGNDPVVGAFISRYPIGKTDCRI